MNEALLESLEVSANSIKKNCRWNPRNKWKGFQGTSLAVTNGKHYLSQVLFSTSGAMDGNCVTNLALLLVEHAAP